MPSLDEDAVKKLAVNFGSDTTQWRATFKKSQEFFSKADILSV
jgi:hypothetical protein